MARKNIVIYGSVLILSLILAGIWVGVSISQETEAAVYYQEGTRLKLEAEKSWKAGNIQDALVNYGAALAKFEFISRQYPKWQSEDIPLPQLIKDCEGAIRLSEATIRINQGNSYLGKHQYNEALTEYNIVLGEYKDIRKSYSLAQTYTGITYQQIGQYKEAINRYNIVLNEYNDQTESCAIAQTYLGLAYYQMGNYEDALNAYKGALNICKDYKQLCAQSLAGIGEVYRITGRYEEARKAFQELTTKYPDSLQAQAIGNINEVLPVESWQEKMDQTPNVKEATVIVQKFLSDQISQKDFQDSLIALDKKNENDVFYVIGLKYQTMGNLGEAEKYYQKCIDVSIEGDDKDVAYDLAMKALEHLRSQKR